MTRATETRALTGRDLTVEDVWAVAVEAAPDAVRRGSFTAAVGDEVGELR